MSPTSMPLGSRAGLAASFATSLMVVVRFVPAAENTPSANFTSSSATPSRCAALCGLVSVDLPAAARTRHPRGRRGARAAGALAEEQLVGVALQILHLGRIEP